MSNPFSIWQTQSNITHRLCSTLTHKVVEKAKSQTKVLLINPHVITEFNSSFSLNDSIRTSIEDHLYYLTIKRNWGSEVHNNTLYNL